MKTFSDLMQQAGFLATEDYPGMAEINIKFDEPHKKVRPTQVGAVKDYINNPWFGDFSEPSTGKTLPAQAMALLYNFLGHKVVVCMPPVLLVQFSKSLASTFEGYDKFFNLHTLTEGPAKRIKLVEEWQKSGHPHLFLLSYAMFRKLQPYLSAVGYKVLICDEAHELKNKGKKTSHGGFTGSKINAMVKEFIGDDRDKTAFLPMTGTPVGNTILDAYGLISLLDPEAYASKRSFERLHCDYDFTGPRKVLIGTKQEELLNSNLYRFARRVRKSDVMSSERPTVIIEDIELSPTHKALYKKLINQRFLEVDGEIIDAMNEQALRQMAMRIVTNPQLFVDSDKKVENNVVLYLKTKLDSLGLNKTNKVIVYCKYRPTINNLMIQFSNYNPVSMFSETKNKEDSRQKFLHDDNCLLMFAHPLSGGAGLDLQSVSCTEIFVEPDLTSGNLEQASSRVDRPGQMNPVTLFIVRVKGTNYGYAIRRMLGRALKIKDINKDRHSIIDSLMGIE